MVRSVHHTRFDGGQPIVRAGVRSSVAPMGGPAHGAGDATSAAPAPGSDLFVFYGVMSVVFFKWVGRGEDDQASAQVGWVQPSAS